MNEAADCFELRAEIERLKDARDASYRYRARLEAEVEQLRTDNEANIAEISRLVDEKVEGKVIHRHGYECYNPGEGTIECVEAGAAPTYELLVDAWAAAGLIEELTAAGINARKMTFQEWKKYGGDQSVVFLKLPEYPYSRPEAK